MNLKSKKKFKKKNKIKSMSDKKGNLKKILFWKKSEILILGERMKFLKSKWTKCAIFKLLQKIIKFKKIGIFSIIKSTGSSKKLKINL